jgi:hypothetical protein
VDTKWGPKAGILFVSVLRHIRVKTYIRQGIYETGAPSTIPTILAELQIQGPPYAVRVYRGPTRFAPPIAGRSRLMPALEKTPNHLLFGGVKKQAMTVR